MSSRSRLLAVAAIVLAGVSVVLSLAVTPAVPALVSDLVPAMLEVPTGSVLLDSAGSRVPVLESVTSGGLDVLRLPVLLPGVYVLSAPSASLAGVHALVSAPVTIVAGTGPASLPDAFGVVEFLMAALVVGFALLAGLIRSRLAWLPLVVALGVLGVWAVSGHPDGFAAGSLLVALLAVASLVAAFVGVKASRLKALLMAALAFAALGLAPLAAIVVLLLVLTAVLVRARWFRWTSAVLVLSLVVVALTAALASAPPRVDAAPVSVQQCLDIAERGSTPSASFALTSAEYADCWRALGVHAASGRSLAEASDVLREAMASAGGVALASACHVAGDAMTAAVARRAVSTHDVARLASSIESVCDFNGPHGYAIGAFVGVPPAAWEERAVQVCSVPGPSELPELTWVTQCWHGVGQAVARESGFDVAAVERVCAHAPSQGDRANCGEGLFAEALDERMEHFDNVGGSHLATVGSLPQMCLRASDELSQGCFRYIGVEFGTGDKAVDAITRGVVGVCQAQVPGSLKQEQCWWGIGSVLANNPPVRRFEPAKQHLLTWCAKAPSVVTRSGCVVRGLANLVSIEVSEGRAIEVEPLCAYLSGPHRETDCAGLVNLPNTITGKGHSY